MPTVLRVYPDGRRVCVEVSYWDLEKRLHVSIGSRPMCAHRVHGEWRSKGNVPAQTLRMIEQEERC